MLATPTSPAIVVQGNVEGSIVVGDHNFVVNTNYGTIVNRQAAPRVKLRDAVPAPPRQPRGFVGRANEIAQLEQLILGRQVALVSGPDGIGKTALVKQAANTRAGRTRPQGVVFVEGVDEEGAALSPGDVIQRLFDALFESDPPLKVNATIARTYLSNTTPLVVLDGTEVTDSALTTFSDLFPQAAMLIAATRPPASDTAQIVKMDPLSREESMQLFAAKRGVAVDDSNRAAIDSLCGLLADMPLALVTAANVVREKKVTLERALEILTASHPPSPDPLRAGVERAYALVFALLTPEERKMLSTAAALPGVSVDRPWLESVAGGQATSANLEALGLLNANSPRLRVPPGLRAAALVGVNVAAPRERQLAFLRQELARRPRDFGFVGDELGNLLGLHEWVLAQQRWEDVIALGRAMDPYLTLRGLWDAWRTVLERVLQAARLSGNRPVEGWALHQLGTREIGAGERNQAIGLLQQALALRQSIGDVIGAAHTRHNLDLLLPPPPPLSDPPKSQPPSGPRFSGLPGGFFGTGMMIVIGVILAAVFSSTPVIENFAAIMDQGPGVSRSPTLSSPPTRSYLPAPSVTPNVAPASTHTPTPSSIPSVTPTATNTPTNTATATWTPTRTAAPVTVVGCQGYPRVSSFYASPSSIQQGQAAKLIWGGVTNMDYVSIDPGVGYVAAAGSGAVWPNRTTTYTLTAHCGSRVATLQATVTVTQLPLVCQGAPSVVSFDASSTKGSAAPDTLSWKVSNADAVQIDQGIGNVPTSGSMSIAPKTTTTYTLTASCGSIITTQSTMVYVTRPSVCQGSPKIERFAVSSSLTVAVVWDTLSWKVSNADAVQIDQGIGRVPTSGSRRISPKTTTTYTLTASCGSITTTQSATVNVPSPSVCQVKPYIERFTASPSVISVGQKSTLSWLAGPSSAIYVEIDQGIGRVATSGSRIVSPGTDTTYTLTAYCDAYTKVSRQTTVKVIWLNIVAPRSRTPVPFGFVTRIPVLPK